MSTLPAAVLSMAIAYALWDTLGTMLPSWMALALAVILGLMLFRWVKRYFNSLKD